MTGQDTHERPVAVIMSKNLSKEERRRQLLDAAIEAFGNKGYHETQVSDIVDGAGVARGTFYLHFKGKREIFDEIMEELFQRVSAEVRTLPKDAVAAIPAQLMGNIERVMDLMFDRPVLGKLLVNASVGVDPERDAHLRKFYGQLLDLIRRGLRQGHEMGFVREANYDVLSISLLGTIKEILYQNLLETEPLKRSEVIEEIYRLVLHAVAEPTIVPELKAALGS